MNNHAISDRNYEHVLTFWEIFKMTTMKDCHDFNLKCDTLLLASLFVTFRKGSINFFELDTAHYSSTTGYIWDTILRFTDVKLISDIDSINWLKAR